MLATSTHHQPHHVRREDLTAFARRAESGGLDHRSAEVIALLLTHFTGAQSHTQTDRMVPVEVPALDTLLHGHRTRQRRRRGGEHDHESVAQTLHLGATFVGHRLTENGEVAASHFVGDVRCQTRGQPRGVHHVGEEDHNVVGRHGRPTTWSGPRNLNSIPRPLRPGPEYGESPTQRQWVVDGSAL